MKIPGGKWGHYAVMYAGAGLAVAAFDAFSAEGDFLKAFEVKRVVDWPMNLYGKFSKPKAV